MPAAIRTRISTIRIVFHILFFLFRAVVITHLFPCIQSHSCTRLSITVCPHFLQQKHAHRPSWGDAWKITQTNYPTGKRPGVDLVPAGQYGYYNTKIIKPKNSFIVFVNKTISIAGKGVQFPYCLINLWQGIIHYERLCEIKGLPRMRACWLLN